MADPLSCVPVKSNHNDTDVQGVQPVFKVRQPENAIGDPIAYKKQLERISLEFIEKWNLVTAKDREAAELCAKGKHLYGHRRHQWISGQTGVLISEVKLILR